MNQMATVSPVGTWISKGVYQTTWSGITGSGTVINPENGPRLPDKTIYVSGNSGSAVATLRGTNLSTGAISEAVGLVDPQGNSISFTSVSAGPGIEQVLENPLKIYPRVSGSTGGTSLTFTMVARGDL